jgi:hypothetical protein
MASGEPYQAFAVLVTMKHHLLDLLREQGDRDRSMLVQMGGGTG